MKKIYNRIAEQRISEKNFYMRRTTPPTKGIDKQRIEILLSVKMRQTTNVKTNCEVYILPPLKAFVSIMIQNNI